MNAEERSKLPPPECCRECAKCWKTVSPTGIERHECTNGHLMHPDCKWMEERTPSLIGETK